MRRLLDALNTPITFPAWFTFLLLAATLIGNDLGWLIDAGCFLAGVLIYLALRRWDSEHWA